MTRAQLDAFLAALTLPPSLLRACLSLLPLSPPLPPSPSSLQLLSSMRKPTSAASYKMNMVAMDSSSMT